MARQLELLSKPTRRHRTLMHVVDAGDGVISLRCSKCSHATGWISWDRETHPVSKMKRGVPCPMCTDECLWDMTGKCTCGGAHGMESVVPPPLNKEWRMSETKFTPGPWAADPMEGMQQPRVRAGAGKHIAVVGNGERPWLVRDEWISHAQLIAAAPDLYSALVRCLAYIEGDELSHGRQFGEGNEARSALCRALGENGQ